MAEKCIPELAVQYMKNIGSLEEIRSFAIREMADFLLSVKHECSHRNILRVAGNFVIDQFTQDPVTPNKRGLLTSDFAKITTRRDQARPRLSVEDQGVSSRTVSPALPEFTSHSV